MLKSLYSGVSGMKAFQEKLDVIGNNIANVSTTGFKSSRATFKDMLSQTTSDATSASTNLGGKNATQVGLGVQVGAVDTINTRGSLQSTSRNLDNAIDGDGYYMVAKGPTDFGSDITVATNSTSEQREITSTGTSGLSVMYTRDGGFELDSNGNLLTSDGDRVLGYSIGSSIDSTGKLVFVNANATTAPTADDGSLKTLVIPKKVGDANVKSYSIDSQGVITAVLDDNTIAAIGQIAMANFNNPEGLEKLGSNLYQQSNNSGVAIIRSGIGDTTDDNSKTFGDNVEGVLEGSNVDLAGQFTDMITANRAFQANSKTITTGDEILQSIIGIIR